MARKELAAVLQGTRGYFVQQTAGLSEEQLLAVPDGIGHNILWNIGHVLDSQYSMTYGASGLDLPCPAEWKELFKGGSSPADWNAPPNIAEVMEHFQTSTAKVAEDLLAGAFDGFDKLDLGPITLTSIEQVLSFHLFHEGIHQGMVMEIKKLV